MISGSHMNDNVIELCYPIHNCWFSAFIMTMPLNWTNYISRLCPLMQTPNVPYTIQLHTSTYSKLKLKIRSFRFALRSTMKFQITHKFYKEHWTAPISNVHLDHATRGGDCKYLQNMTWINLIYTRHQYSTLYYS